MRTFIPMLILLVCFCTLAHAAQKEPVPLIVKGKTLLINTASDRSSITASLKEIFKKDTPSVSIPERIQYDFIAVKDQGPVMLMFDFNKSGKWDSITIESNMKEQNPVAQQLIHWLVPKAGKGKKAGKATIWKYDGLVYRLREIKDAGEESVYGMTISKK